MRIHSVIFVVQLKFIIIIVIEASDPYMKRINIESSSIRNEDNQSEDDEIEMDKIMSKRITRGKFEYLFI